MQTVVLQPVCSETLRARLCSGDEQTGVVEVSRYLLHSQAEQDTYFLFYLYINCGIIQYVD